MPKRLNENENKELKLWLVNMKIPANKLHREFSDAVPMAQLLKKLYPKMIDLHNYPPRNSTQLKLNNWETLNSKVLGKLGLHQGKRQLEKFAKAVPGAIEILLNGIMQQRKTIELSDGKSKDEQEQRWTDNDEVMIVQVKKQIGDAFVHVPQKMILYSIYEQKLREIATKDAYISATKQKIAHLENIINLKAERIEELCAQLERLAARSLTKQTNFEKYMDF